MTSGSPLRWLTDLIRPRGAVLGAVERGAGEYLERLLITNATRTTSDLDERVLESRRRMELEIRTSLREIYTSAERALEGARARRAAGAAAVEAELRRIEALRRAITALHPAPVKIN